MCIWIQFYVAYWYIIKNRQAIKLVSSCFYVVCALFHFNNSKHVHILSDPRWLRRFCRLFTEILRKEVGCEEIKFIEDGSWQPLLPKDQEDLGKAEANMVVESIDGEYFLRRFEIGLV